IGSWGVEHYALPKVGDLVIGRGVDADVRINDASISRKHAALSLGLRVRVRDLGSSSGTRVADRALATDEWAEVSPGAVVDLGAVMLILSRGDEQADAEPPKAAGAMERAERLLDRIAPGEISVLIQGETGAGKEVFAERLHAKSRRAAGPLLRLNCGGFTETL